MPVLFSASLLLTALGSRATLDGHEVLVAQTAREMLRTGDWIVPRFAGEPRLQKPPLAYWLVAATFAITGQQSELTARLPTALATVLLVWLVAWFAARCFGQRMGLLTGMIHATMGWTIAFGKLALVDGILVLLVALAIVLATLDRGKAISGRGWSVTLLLFWACCGLSVLAKGPVGLAIIAPTVMLYRLLRPKSPTDRPFLWHWVTIPGLLLFGTLSLGWPLLVYLKHPGALLLWYGQSVERFTTHWGPNTRPWFYYLYQVPLWTLPWTGAWMLELFAGIRGARQASWRADQGRLLLWLWLVVALVFFSLSAGKREHYILPGLTPLSILAALGMQRWASVAHPQLLRWQTPLRWATIALAGIAGIAIVILAQSLQAAGLVVGLLLLTVTAAGSIFSLFTWACRPAQLKWAWILFVWLGAAVLIHDVSVSPRLRCRSAALSMFARQREVLDRAEVVLQFGSNDRWTVFALDRPMSWPRSVPELTSLLAEHADVPILVPEQRRSELEQLVPCRVLDRMGETASLAESDPRQRLLLAQPIPEGLRR